MEILTSSRCPSLVVIAVEPSGYRTKVAELKTATASRLAGGGPPRTVVSYDDASRSYDASAPSDVSTGRAHGTRHQHESRRRLRGEPAAGRHAGADAGARDRSG